MHSAELSDKPFVNPRLISNDKITVTASSQQLPGNATEGVVEKAFDNDPNTFWHTKWTGDTAPFTLTMTLKEAEKVNGLTYLPRPGDERAEFGNIIDEGAEQSDAFVGEEVDVFGDALVGVIGFAQ